MTEARRPAVRRAAVRRAAADLQVWAYPLILAQRLRFNFTQPADPLAPRPPVSAGAALGRFGHARRLADPALRVGVAPNVDTLYSVAWLDVRRGPHRVVLPTATDRYLSLQVGKADTTSPVVISRRSHPEGFPELVVERGAPGVVADPREVRVTTRDRWLMLVGRTGVEPEDPADLAAAHAVQDALSLRGPHHETTAVDGEADEVDVALAAVERDHEILDPGAFARALRRVLATGGESVAWERRDALLEAVRLDELARDHGDEELRSAVADGLRDGYDAVRAHVRALGGAVAGWALNEKVASFGEDHLSRAAVAHSQIYVNPPEEASYPVCEVDAEGRALDGRDADYRIAFAPGTPPVRGFWSLTMYRGVGNLVANELGRYAIGDRTRGLERSADGSLEIDISARRPDRGAANWLPAPRGPFRLMLRLYWPCDPSWQPPPVIRRMTR
ncbi:DUF1214 domain-containing protein [Nocardioides nitrophenolicus]|uniref:DUF1214 domain-containing protein n=1 Tax=Nocardioides nitrophenolicus TaxID=60489 RepID=UPI00195EEFDE|nr:DUF1214 domain-containing protein [Nocardioides nitrophenolicus]MBM7518501.1 hypothetical protein [Nocardioides nitrophenolicus]